MFLDKIFSNEQSNINNQDEVPYSKSQIKNINSKKNTRLDINRVNNINNTIEFLLKMNNSNLLFELYNFMKAQVITYSQYNNHKVLELTQEQLLLLEKYKIDLELFKNNPFNIDSIVVYQNRYITYRYFDSESELNKFESKSNSNFTDDIGLYYLTLNNFGYLGEGLYVCDIEEDDSCYLFNNLIYDRINMINKMSDGYIYFLEGNYSGLVKKCIYGKLKGMSVIIDKIKNKHIKKKEELHLYGEISESEYNYNVKDINLDLKLQQNFSGIRLSSVKDEVLISAKG